MDTRASMNKNISTPEEVCTQYLRFYTERKTEEAKRKYEGFVQPAKSPSLLETFLKEALNKSFISVLSVKLSVEQSL